VKILFLNTFDVQGGASAAAMRLYRSLPGQGVEVCGFVQEKGGDDPGVATYATLPGMHLARLRHLADMVPLYSLYPGRQRVPFSLNWLLDGKARLARRLRPDAAHLHWIHSGYMDVKTLRRLDVPLVWTCHDMWAATGGCHYAGDCDRYRHGCGRCPILKGGPLDLSHWLWRRKRKAFRGLDLRVAAPSRWLGECLRQSPLLEGHEVRTIPYGIDTDVFAPFPQDAARKVLGLPRDKRLVLFGAYAALADPRKGAHLLGQALEHLAAQGDGDVELAVFGSPAPQENPFAVPAHFLGRLNDALTLRLAYAAADVFVAPSLQENLACTVLEALACGRPVVAFDVGGMPDMIEPGVNGCLARPYSARELAECLAAVLEPANTQHFGSAAREKALAEYSLPVQARRYRALYSDAVSG
jgi:glycosyltransferase involved in cell wall biosynthesis